MPAAVAVREQIGAGRRGAKSRWMKPARSAPMNHGSNWLESALLQRAMWSRKDIGSGR